MKRDIDWWDRWFLGMAKYVATASKDPSTKVGAVIVDPMKRVVSMGFNGFPRGVNDDDRLDDRERKYEIVCHAEVNAAVFAQRPLNDCSIYVWPLPPCSRCASILIQSGIKRVVSPPPLDRWKDSCALSAALFAEAGVEPKMMDCDQLDAAGAQPLSELSDQAKKRVEAMSEDEIEAMLRAQRESFVRGMTTPCEHGVLDFEQCSECRASALSSHNCASEGCEQPATERFEAGGVGSIYCADCIAKVAAIASAPVPQDRFLESFEKAIAECKLMAQQSHTTERDKYFYRGVAAAVDTLEIFLMREKDRTPAPESHVEGPDLTEFRKFVDLIEARAMACDGPVTPFLEQLNVASDAEKERFTKILAAIYQSPAPVSKTHVDGERKFCDFPECRCGRTVQPPSRVECAAVD